MRIIKRLCFEWGIKASRIQR